MVEYSYDAWGKLLTTTGSLASTVGAKNPYRYRGYRYDSETGLYYLNSRYYNPEIGRFINADDTAVLQLSQGDFANVNLFAYCGNNPITGSDPSGYFVKAVFGAVIGAAIATVTYWLEVQLGMRSWNWWHFGIHVGLSAALGAIGGYLRGWTEFARIAKHAKVPYILKNPVVRDVIDWGSRGATFAINAIAKKFTRYPGEDWVKAIKRWFGW